jgi:hypothetical protein
VKSLTVALVLVSALVTIGLTLIASEMHYGNCVHAAQARYPQPVVSERERLIGSDELVAAQRRSIKAVDGCSRVP